MLLLTVVRHGYVANNVAFDWPAAVNSKASVFYACFSALLLSRLLINELNNIFESSIKKVLLQFADVGCSMAALTS